MSLKIKLYNTTSPENMINKVLVDEVEYSIVFKNVVNILQPVVQLQVKLPEVNYNFAFIPDFERYYFINKLESQPNNMWILTLSEDVLMSYKEDILESVATVSRSPESNKFYDGGDYRSEVRNTHTIHESDKEIKFEQSTVLVTLGS